MVKLMYLGVMMCGNVAGVGIVENGIVYDVSEDVAKRLLAAGEWKMFKEKNEERDIKKKKHIVKDSDELVNNEYGLEVN